MSHRANDDMIPRLPKDEVQKLTPEQQEIFGRMILEEKGRQRALMSQAKGYHGYRAIPWFLLFAGFLFWEPIKSSGNLEMVLACAGFLLIHFHAMGVNSRIDAILDLHDLDRAKDFESKPEQAVDPTGTLPASTESFYPVAGTAVARHGEG